MTVFELIHYSNPILEGQPSAPILTSQIKEQERKVEKKNDSNVLYLPHAAIQNLMTLIAIRVCVSQEKTKELAQKQAQQWVSRSPL